MPIKAANYIGLDTGKTGVLFLSEIPDVPSLTEPTLVSVSKFELSTRKTEPFLAGVSLFVVSANGEKALYRQGPGPAAPWFIAVHGGVPKPGDGALNLMGWRSHTDPRVGGTRCTTKSGELSAIFS